MKIGLISPYAWDVPGGVQAHIRDLANHYLDQGHQISVLAPASDESSIVEDFVVSAGRPVAIPYNGAVARVLFGPVAASRVRQWVAGGDFDVLHLHEPAIPSLSLLACSIAEGPLVGTFHAAAPRQKVTFAIAPFLEPVIEKLRARIAVSEIARETLRIHLDTDAIVIPNGISAEFFGRADSNPAWKKELTIGFIGRFSEPRKGLNVLLEALPKIARFLPEFRLLIAGPGEGLEAMESVNPALRSRITFLGRVDDDDKASLLKSISVYVAPNTGGESFGIILTEAMAAGVPIVASNIPAFSQLLEDGKYGLLFESENASDLADKLIRILKDKELAAKYSESGLNYSARFDWKQVGEEIMNVYLHARGENERVTLLSEARPWSRLFTRGEEE
ncbi:MAG: glycosyltransferase family 1 protein [Actinobacteria bacterium]|nr:glycosyltransferase family 1 protein [Actinomycetota bacterium]